MVTSAYIYSPTTEDLKEQDTGWLPKCIDMLTLVEQYNRWEDEGKEQDWWGSLHGDDHPNTCVDCIDVNIWVDEDEACLSHGEDIDDCIGNLHASPNVTIYPVYWEGGNWHVDTQRWFDVTDYLRTTLCIECGEYKPDDDRVFGGMKCGECAYA